MGVGLGRSVVLHDLKEEGEGLQSQ